MAIISIKGVDKSELLAALYNNSKPQGMGIFHFDPTPMTKDDATQLLSQTHVFDYLKGRVMKVDLSGYELDTYGYDRDLGQGAVEAIVNDLRE